ncbi:MAG: hypothetical protein KQ78_01468 [Candidatus Izimaplasma bacterium HR2]|nr:MAG: hypothetical protein KQ78_01468 [Candidatus Izimaplasma bacterium HR2]
MTTWDTQQAEELKTSMENILDTSTIDIESIQSEGMTIRIGGKVVKLEITEEVSLPEDEIRAEYSAKLTEKLQRIKEALNEKMSEMTYMVEQNRQDFEEKEKELQERLASANIMPEISYDHAKAGLSLVKQHSHHDGADVLTWLFQGVYWPKYVDGNPINPKYAKRMISPVTMEIVTKKDRIVRVVVRKTIGLSKFEHYHSMDSSSDCWGQWEFPKRWNSPDDILSCARDALAVLENVNTTSPGNRNPSGLPRLSTLEQHILSGEEARNVRYATSRGDERAGIVEQSDRGEGHAVWST